MIDNSSRTIDVQWKRAWRTLRWWIAGIVLVCCVAGVIWIAKDRPSRGSDLRSLGGGLYVDGDTRVQCEWAMDGNRQIRLVVFRLLPTVASLRSRLVIGGPESGFWIDDNQVVLPPGASIYLETSDAIFRLPLSDKEASHLALEAKNWDKQEIQSFIREQRHHISPSSSNHTGRESAGQQ